MPEQKKPSLDLDALEREDDPGPFTVQLGGDRFTFADPQEMDWRELTNLPVDGEEAVIRRLVGAEYDKFAQHALPTWKYKRMVQAWREHYGMPAMGESLASSD